MSTSVQTLPLTFADVIERIRNDQTLDRGSRKSMASSLRTLARVAGQPVETIRADLAHVRDLVSQTSPARAGLSIAYWTNVKCHVMSALRYCGIKVLSGRCQTALPEDWASLVREVKEHHRRVMLGFFRYCIERGLGPCDWQEPSSRNPGRGGEEREVP